jgi:hypothetical protein
MKITAAQLCEIIAEEVKKASHHPAQYDAPEGSKKVFGQTCELVEKVVSRV